MKFGWMGPNLLRLRRPGTRDWLGLKLKVEMGMDMDMDMGMDMAF